MSMTREEAIELLCHGDWLNVISEHIGKQDTERIAKAMCIVGKALRPVSRERVEKVWRGEWIGDNDEKVGTIDGSPIKSSTCSACGNWLVGSDEYDCAGYFCPACGRAMTDEAVEITMRRLEALYENRD